MAEPSTALLVFQGQYLSSVNLVKQFLLEDIAASFHLRLKNTKRQLEIKNPNYFEANTNQNMMFSIAFHYHVL